MLGVTDCGSFVISLIVFRVAPGLGIVEPARHLEFGTALALLR